MSKRWPGGVVTKSPTTPKGPYKDGAAPGVWTVAEATYWAKQGVWPNPTFSGYMIQSTYDAARSWEVTVCCHDSAGNTYSVWTTTGVIAIIKHNVMNVQVAQVSLTIGISDINKLVVDSNGYLYLSGTSSSRPAVLKLNPDLSVAFFNIYTPVRSSYNFSFGYMRDLAVDSSGNIYACGSGQNTSGQSAYTVGWIYKLDSSGVVQWVKEYSDGFGSENYGCAIGPNDGNIYVVGSSSTYNGNVYLYYSEVTVVNPSTGALISKSLFLGPSYSGGNFRASYGRGIEFTSNTTFNMYGTMNPSGADALMVAYFTTSIAQPGVGGWYKSSQYPVNATSGKEFANVPNLGAYAVNAFEYNNNGYSSAVILTPSTYARMQINSSSTLKDTYFYGISYNSGNGTLYTYGSIKNTTGSTNNRGIIFNYVRPQSIPTTELASSGVILAEDTFGGSGISLTKSTTTPTSSITSTTAAGTVTIGTTLPTLTTTAF